MDSTEFLAIRKIQKERGATDYEAAQMIDAVNAGNSTFEAVFDMAIIEVTDEGYRPEGYPPLPSWCVTMETSYETAVMRQQNPAFDADERRREKLAEFMSVNPTMTTEEALRQLSE